MWASPNLHWLDRSGKERGREWKLIASLLTVFLRHNLNFFSDIFSFENLLMQDTFCIISSTLDFLRYVAWKLISKCHMIILPCRLNALGSEAIYCKYSNWHSKALGRALYHSLLKIGHLSKMLRPIFHMLISYNLSILIEPVPSKRCWLSILQVPAAAIAAFSSCKENPWISPAQQYPSYFFKQQEAVRMAPVSEALSSKATSASQCTTRRKRQAFKLVSQATATASAEGSRQTLLSFPYALSAQHQLQRAQVSQWYSSDILKGKTQKSRSSAGASYFQLYIFPATLHIAAQAFTVAKDEFCCFPSS